MVNSQQMDNPRLDIDKVVGHWMETSDGDFNPDTTTTKKSFMLPVRSPLPKNGLKKSKRCNNG